MRRPLALLLVLLVVVPGCVSREDPGAPRGAVEDEDLSAADAGSDEDQATTTAPPPRDPSPASASGEPASTPPPSSGGEPAPANETQPEPSSGDPQPFEPEEATAPCDSLELRSPLTADPSGLAGGWPLLALDVVVLADPTFVAAHPDDWEALLRALVGDASARYEAQLGLTLVPTLVDRLPEGSLDPDATQGDIIPVARGFMLANHPEVPHDIVATILGSDHAGTVAGMADCVGGAFTPDTGYFWAEYVGSRAGDGLVFKDVPLKTFMHEAAHLLGAHHHYSNCGEALLEFAADDALAVCDVMINDIGLASFRFGPLNRLVMRSFVEEHGIGTSA